jgi:hypothetical protein
MCYNLAIKSKKGEKTFEFLFRSLKVEKKMKFWKISLIIASLSLGLSADSIDDKFQSLVGKSMFIGNSSNLQGGHYKFDKEGGNKPELSDAGITFPYYFGEEGDLWRPFILGGIGYSKIEEENSNLRGTNKDKIEFTSIYYKIGGGITYNPTCDFSFVVGGSALVANSDGDYKTKVALSNSSTDKKIKKLLDDDSTNKLYDGYGGFIYKPTIFGYKSELKSNLHYIKMDFDNGDDVDGVYLDLLAKVRSNELTTLWCEPVWIEYYVGGDFVNSKLADVVGFNSAISVGSTLHWRVGPLIPIIKDSRFKDLNLAINVQKTISNRDFEGWKAGVGFSLVKF